MDWQKYNEKFYKKPNEILDRENKYLVELIETMDLSGGLCLDFGCGSGYWVNVLNQKDAKVIGVDISEKAIRECQNKFQAIQFILTSEKKLPFFDQCFDCILCAWVFQESIEDEIQFLEILRELRRILKYGGTIIVVENEYPNERVLVQNSKYGDLFVDEGKLGKIRFFQNNTMQGIMKQENLQRISYHFTGNSFFEVYEKK